MAANEVLFSKLADALGQPSKTYRAIQTGLQIPEQVRSGYLEGQEYRQKVDQYRLLNSPLGTLYHDPAQIPFGLSPDHTVKDLLTIAPAIENYIPPEVAQSFLGGQSSTGNNRQTPPPNIAHNPDQPQGTTNLAAIQGTGQGDQNIVPPGQPLSIPPTQVAGNSGAGANFPATGMSAKNLQTLLPIKKMQTEAAQFQQGQAAEESRFQRKAAQENQFHDQALNAEESKFQREHIAAASEKIAPSIQDLAGIKNLISQIEPLIAHSSPIPGLGNVGANLSDKLGGIGTPQMKLSLAINNAGGALSAALDKNLAGRFNENEAALLKQTLVPNGNDQPGYAQDKLTKLKAFIGTLESGNEQAINNMARALSGNSINSSAPSGPSRPIASGASGPMIAIRDSQGGSHRIPVSALGKAKQRDPGLQVVNQ